MQWSCVSVSIVARLVLVGCALLLVAGCAPTQASRDVDRAVADYVVGDYAASAQLLRPLAAKTDENFVLNNCRLGSSTLANYNLPEAESAFLRAYEVINSVGVNNGGRSLGAALVDEKIKVWRGEPFERAMANFYLGLVYYMQHDYANGRAAFENALFKLRDHGEGDDKADQYRAVESNFALAYLMLGRCNQRLDEPEAARKAFARAAELRPYLAPQADYDRNARANVLLVIDFGYGPAKARNYDGAVVGFRPTPQEQGPILDPVIVVDGRATDTRDIARPPIDLLALAQDRRWQSIDTIRAVKTTLGTGLIAAGAYEGFRRNSDPALALGLIAGGALLKATSIADIRQWEMLPRTTFVIPLSLPPGVHDLLIDFPNAPGVRQEWHGLIAPKKGEATYYFRIQRYNNGPFTWPPPAATQAQADGR